MNKFLLLTVVLCSTMAIVNAMPSAASKTVEEVEKRFNAELKEAKKTCAGALKPVEKQYKAETDKATREYKEATDEATQEYQKDLDAGMPAQEALLKFGKAVNDAQLKYQAEVREAQKRFEQDSRPLVADCEQTEQEIKREYLEALQKISCPDKDCEEKVGKLIDSLTRINPAEDRAAKCKQHMKDLQAHFSARIAHAEGEHTHQVKALDAQLENGTITPDEHKMKKQEADNHLKQAKEHHQSQRDQTMADAQKSCS